MLGPTIGVTTVMQGGTGCVNTVMQGGTGGVNTVKCWDLLLVLLL